VVEKIVESKNADMNLSAFLLLGLKLRPRQASPEDKGRSKVRTPAGPPSLENSDRVAIASPAGPLLTGEGALP